MKKKMATEIEIQLQTLEKEAQSAIAHSDNLKKLEELRVAYLGKKRRTIINIKGYGQTFPGNAPGCRCRCQPN